VGIESRKEEDIMQAAVVPAVSGSWQIKDGRLITMGVDAGAALNLADGPYLEAHSDNWQPAKRP